MSDKQAKASSSGKEPAQGSLDSEVRRAEEDAVKQLHAQRRVRIIIPSGRDSHERAPVALAINGREFLIVRDKEVLVPEGVVNVLSLAREQVAVPFEENGRRMVKWEDAPRFPFQILGYEEPEQAEAQG